MDYLEYQETRQPPIQGTVFVNALRISISLRKCRLRPRMRYGKEEKRNNRMGKGFSAVVRFGPRLSCGPSPSSCATAQLCNGLERFPKGNGLGAKVC